MKKGIGLIGGRMKKYLPIILIATVTLLVHVCCEIPGMTTIPDDLEPDTYYFGNIHIRNMSTISGVTFGYGIPIGGTVNAYTNTYLDPSPQSGVPVDTSIGVWAYSYGWRVERAIDSVVIDSGMISIAPDQWLLIEGRPEVNNGEWSCTWSDEPWQ